MVVKYVNISESKIVHIQNHCICNHHCLYSCLDELYHIANSQDHSTNHEHNWE